MIKRNVSHHVFFLMNLIIVLSVISIKIVSAQSQDIMEQKKDLERIKSEIDRSKQNLDSLKGVEKKVKKEISDYEQRANMNKTVLNRLNRQLNNLRGNINSSKSHLDSTENLLTSTRQRYLGNLQYYYSGVQQRRFSFADMLREQHDAILKMVYLRALAVQDRAELSQVEELLAGAETEYASLVVEEKTVGNVQKQKKREHAVITSQKQKKEKDLTKVRRKKENETDRLVTLSEAAQQMEDLIARLEQARRDRELANKALQVNLETGNFVTYKGGMPAPFNGKVIENYGWKTDKITYLKSFSPGIEIEGRKKASVLAVASGIVAYTGSMRGYGNFVIIEHEDGYYTTYAGMGNVSIVQNQLVDRGDLLGDSGDGKLRFELRKGRQSLDPVEWIQIDSFK